MRCHKTKSLNVKCTHNTQQINDSECKSIAKKRRVFSRNVQISSASKDRLHVCDVFDCGSVHTTARGLAVHKTKCPSKRLQADNKLSVELDTVSVSTIDR